MRIYTIDAIKRELIQTKVWRTPITICGEFGFSNDANYCIFSEDHKSYIAISWNWNPSEHKISVGDIIKITGFLNYKGQQRGNDTTSIICNIDFPSKLYLYLNPVDYEIVKSKTVEDINEDESCTSIFRINKYTLIIIGIVFILTIIIFLTSC